MLVTQPLTKIVGSLWSLFPPHNESPALCCRRRPGEGGRRKCSESLLFPFISPISDRAERLTLGGLRVKGRPICYQLRGVSQSLSIGLLTAAPSAAKHVNVIELCGDVRNNVAVWVAEVGGGRPNR